MRHSNSKLGFQPRGSASNCDTVSFLRRPEHYPEHPPRVEVIETHFAWVFLTDLCAYKLKKPVRRAGLDYRGIAARRRGCRDELILNRRLAPSVYLSLVPITRARDGTLALGPGAASRVVDWVVQMRRLPAERMLDRAIAARRIGKGEAQSLAATLTKFFDTAVRRPMSASAYVERLRGRIIRNELDLCAPELLLDQARVQRISAMQLQFLLQHQGLLGVRAAHLIDGHGDLRPEHLYLGGAFDAPCVIDCLEFDEDLRWLDPAEEMAFLALECRKLGGHGVARRLLAYYRAATLTPPSDALLCFYMSHSALTRAKLAAWHVCDPELASRAALWRSRALSYLSAAARYLRQAGEASASAPIQHRPALEQGRERLTG